MWFLRTYLELVHVEGGVDDLAVALPLVAVDEDEPFAEQAGKVVVDGILWEQPRAVREHLLHHFHVPHEQFRPLPEPRAERTSCMHAHSIITYV